MIPPKGLKLSDLDDAVVTIVGFIKEYVENAKADGAILGLSGGIDSSLVAKLACEAIGHDAVHGMIMPVKIEADSKNAADATSLADSLGIKYQIFELGPLLDAFQSLELGKTAMGNLAARMRMATLYAKANENGLLVLGTGNRSEIMTGYFTKYGDGGCDILPIADLYKTNVVELAKHLGLPETIINKIPSAGLWPNQTDEGELGILYSELDTILFLHYEKGLTEDQIIERGIDQTKFKRTIELVSASHHKRAPIPRPIVRQQS